MIEAKKFRILMLPTVVIDSTDSGVCTVYGVALFAITDSTPQHHDSQIIKSRIFPIHVHLKTKLDFKKHTRHYKVP